MVSGEGNAQFRDITAAIATVSGNLKFLTEDVKHRSPLVLRALRDTEAAFDQLAQEVMRLLSSLPRDSRPPECPGPPQPGEQIGERILIVEDDREFSTRLAESFAEWGFEPTVAASFSEACVPMLPYDCAIVDLDLEGRETGFDVLEVLQEQEPKPLCLVLSAYGHPGAVSTAFRCGADNFELKPVTPEEAFRALRKALGAGSGDQPLRRLTLEEVKTAVIQRTYRDCDFNKSLAGQVLGIDRKTVAKYVADD